MVIEQGLLDEPVDAPFHLGWGEALGAKPGAQLLLCAGPVGEEVEGRLANTPLGIVFTEPLQVPRRDVSA